MPHHDYSLYIFIDHRDATKRVMHHSDNSATWHYVQVWRRTAAQHACHGFVEREFWLQFWVLGSGDGAPVPVLAVGLNLPGPEVLTDGWMEL